MLRDDVSGWPRVPRDYKQAEKWYATAAEQGSGWAQMNLGLLYIQGGDGLPRDYGKAIDWFRKAADQGHEQARSSLDRLSGSGEKGFWPGLVQLVLSVLQLLF